LASSQQSQAKVTLMNHFNSLTLTLAVTGGGIMTSGQRHSGH